tara:strand:- start:22586 stop:23416 length:831 start_codon:yes stop_codon:yes gene_type:complete
MILDPIYKTLLKKNYKFLNLYKDKTCYIFGNGASIKYIHLNDFQDLHSISINLMVLHKDFKNLKTCAYVLPESFLFYKYFKNPYDQKFAENIIGNLFRKNIKRFKNINLFTSVTNYLGAPTKNTYFLHHFGKKIPDPTFIDATGCFSFMAGGLYAAIGMAIYMGFAKAKLVGCDYLQTPRGYGHFYSEDKKIVKKDYSNPYQELLEATKDKIELKLITIDADSKWLKTENYRNISSKPIKYKENFEILEEINLIEMERAHQVGQFPHKITSKHQLL